EVDPPLAEALGDHQRHRRVALAHVRGGGGGVERLVDDLERAFGLQRGDELRGALAVVLVGDGKRHPRRLGALRAEDAGEDGEEDDGHDEAENQRAAVAPEVQPSRADDGADHSRSSLPVRWRKTLSSVGTFSTMTTSRFSPTVARTSSS